MPVEAGGQGWFVLEQVLVHEQLGQSTGGLWSYIPGASNVLAHADPDQRRRYLEPSLRGERSGIPRVPPTGQQQIAAQPMPRPVSGRPLVWRRTTS